MSHTFIPADAEEAPEVASYLITLAKEQGYDHKLIGSVVGKGFLVPSEWKFGADEIEEDELIPFKVVEDDVREDGPQAEQRPVDVIVTGDAEGNLYLHGAKAEETPAKVQAHREVVRKWAKDNGYPVNANGAIKKDYYTWYEIAVANEAIRAEAE